MNERAVKSTPAGERLKSAAPDRSAVPDVTQGPTFTGNNLLLRRSSCACGGGCPSCQAKGSLNISQPNDSAEIEADRTADKVMRMSVGETGENSGRPTTSEKISSGGIHRRSL